MTHPHRRIGIVAATLAAIAAIPIPASAQQTVADSGTRITLGLGAAYMPRYAGSDEYKAAALPVISVVTPGAASSTPAKASVIATASPTSSSPRRRSATTPAARIPTRA